MQIEVRLKKILRQYRLDDRGVTQRIAKALNVHRHTIGKLYRSQATNPSLDVLGRLCGWLESQGVPRGVLPEALLGTRPSQLWQAVAAPGAVTLFVGEYHQTVAKRRTARWIAQHDAVAMAKVVQALSSAGDLTDRPPNVGIEYVPFRFVLAEADPRQDHHKEDEKKTREIFRQLRATNMNRSSIIIGSQRANRLVELMVADTFGCRPFSPCKKPGRTVPFYLTYRDDERMVPSCFGGSAAPPGCKRRAGPGVHFLHKKKWVACPWKPGEQDAGVIIAVRDPATGALEIAVFGFSGLGTEALGEQLLRNPDQFWPPPVQVKERQVGVHVCRFGFVQDRLPAGGGEVHVRDVEVIPLDSDVLEEHLK